MMKAYMWFLCFVFIASCCSSVCAYTLTFDDIPTGSYYRDYYGDLYGAVFTIDWCIVPDVGLAGTNAAMWNGPAEHGAGLRFGKREEDIPEYRYTIQSIGAYFNTDMDVVIKIIGYASTGVWTTPVVDATIGTPGESWNNRYVEISSAAGDISYVEIVGISSPDARYHFSIDNVTIEPVPEPSSILALVGGITGLGGFALRRRRN
jgi:hypothetical protein